MINRVKQLLANFDQKKFNTNLPVIRHAHVVDCVFGDAHKPSRKRFQPLYFAEDDLEVLAIVKSWRDVRESDYNLYWWMLAALLRSRDAYYNDTVLTISHLDYMTLYRIGDYSRAAVLAMRG